MMSDEALEFVLAVPPMGYTHLGLPQSTPRLTCAVSDDYDESIVLESIQLDQRLRNKGILH
jgi:hypothetical protein